MTATSYQDAIDSGVYLRGVDTSQVGARLPVAPADIVDPAVFLIIGQSNAANHGATRHACSKPAFNFNPFDGLCYRASDPLLGATGDLGSPWCLLADALIARGFARSILLCPLAVGGATVAEWAPGGPYHHRMTYSLKRLQAAGFRPSHVFWHQGEADALYGTSAEAYGRSFTALALSLRGLGVRCPIHVAIASYFAVPAGYEARQAVIRAAQHSLIDDASGILLGPDTDSIKDRYDGSHMGDIGLLAHALAWEAALVRSPARP